MLSAEKEGLDGEIYHAHKGNNVKCEKLLDHTCLQRRRMTSAAERSSKGDNIQRITKKASNTLKDSLQRLEPKSRSLSTIIFVNLRYGRLPSGYTEPTKPIDDVS